MSFSFPAQVLLFFAVALGLGIAVRVVAAQITHRRFARAGLAEVNRMHWREFEKYLQQLFQTLGYQAEPTVGPACPKCGAPMTARRANDQAIWLCSRFPQCNGSKLK
jgi:hypothetical protein